MEIKSSYLDYLPAIFHDEFMGSWLLAFERVLSGPVPAPDSNGSIGPGLEEHVERIHTYFDLGLGLPSDRPCAPDEFLPWLAGWVALSLRDDWEPDAQRRFISEIVSLYRWRGTKGGLQRMLEIYTQEHVEVYEFERPRHYFQVEVSLSQPADLRRKEKIARAIIDQEKPAHTFYDLQFLVPTMQIRNDLNEERGVGILVGQNTLLGTVVRMQVPTMQIRNDLDAERGVGLLVGQNTKLDTTTRLI
jgi:phage tail-like protein